MTDGGLAAAEQRSLDNVLTELRMTETDEKSGAWLFARITSDGRSAEVERAYDTWPAWYVAPGRRADHVRAARRDGPARAELASRLGAPAALGTLLRSS